MPAQAPTTERRRAPRIQTSFPVAIHDGIQAGETTLQNISSSGAYCTVDRFIAPMTKLQLAFDIPHSDIHIECTGIVVRTSPQAKSDQSPRYDIAIFFSDISDRQRRKLADYIDQRLAG
jgi:hypothetical protein